MRVPLVIVGSVNVDHSVLVERLPEPGETVLASRLVTATGGKGANQAVAAARAGVRPVLLAAVGPDAEPAVESLRFQGVDVSQLQHSTTPTGIALISVDEQGENTIVVAPGANALLDEVVVATRMQSLDPDVLLAQLEVPVPTVLAAARLSRRFVLNYSPALPVPDELLERADPLIVNEAEAAHLSVSPRSLVVTLGSRGARFVDPAGGGDIPAPLVDVVDTTGAGDAFAGTLAAALAGGSSLRDAVAAGVAAGSTVVGFVGAQPALP